MAIDEKKVQGGEHPLDSWQTLYAKYVGQETAAGRTPLSFEEWQGSDAARQQAGAAHDRVAEAEAEGRWGPVAEGDGTGMLPVAPDMFDANVRRQAYLARQRQMGGSRRASFLTGSGGLPPVPGSSPAAKGTSVQSTSPVAARLHHMGIRPGAATISAPGSTGPAGYARGAAPPTVLDPEYVKRRIGRGFGGPGISL